MKIETDITVTLELTEKEALWLMGITQNPLREDESELDNLMRGEFFKTISSRLKPR